MEIPFKQVYFITLSFSSAASRGTTNCGVLTPIAICLSATSLCVNPSLSPTAWAALTPVTRRASRRVTLWKTCWNHWEPSQEKKRTLASGPASLALLPVEAGQICQGVLNLEALLMKPPAGSWVHLQLVLCLHLSRSPTASVTRRSSLLSTSHELPPWCQSRTGQM